MVRIPPGHIRVPVQTLRRSVNRGSGADHESLEEAEGEGGVGESALEEAVVTHHAGIHPASKVEDDAKC